jgi:hypothetical protein
MNRYLFEKQKYLKNKICDNKFDKIDKIDKIEEIDKIDKIEEINYICSLGTLCHTASFLKRNNLKLVSYPFDWIFTNLNNILHIIEDDFKIFLDRNFYISKSEKQCQHIFYYDKECTNNMFNHFNPLINDNDYNYYTRCVNRFRNLLKYTEKKLFIITIVNIDNINNFDESAIISFNNKFSNYTNNYILLIIINISNKDINYNKFTYNNNIHILELHTLTNSNGISFKNENDNIYLDNIIKKKYNFNLKVT